MTYRGMHRARRPHSASLLNRVRCLSILTAWPGGPATFGDGRERAVNEITLDGRVWKLDLDDLLGSGGFGDVYAGLSPRGEPAALKVLPSGPSSLRERLVAPGASGLANVLPIWAHGELNGGYVLAMPRAERSLRELLDSTDRAPMSLNDAKPILLDILAALEAIAGTGAADPIVHRDLKPANVLEWGGQWYVSDFGIARYADVTTASDTVKRAMTPEYAAPEQWRQDRAEPRTDIYAWGVIAFELLGGHVPFPGPTEEEFRGQHLFEPPPDLLGVSDRVVALIKSCLSKQAMSRSTASEVRDRLSSIDESPAIPALARLDHIERQEVERRTNAAVLEAKKVARAERRRGLAADASQSLDYMVSSLWTDLRARMPTIVNEPFVLSTSGLRLTSLIEHSDVRVQVWTTHAVKEESWECVSPTFDVVAISATMVELLGKTDGHTACDYEIWYCNPTHPDQFGWYEMGWSFVGEREEQSSWHDPQVQALSSSITLLTEDKFRWRIAMPLTYAEAGEFKERWLRIIADAFDGTLPEHNSPAAATGANLLGRGGGEVI